MAPPKERSKLDGWTNWPLLPLAKLTNGGPALAVKLASITGKGQCASQFPFVSFQGLQLGSKGHGCQCLLLTRYD